MSNQIDIEAALRASLAEHARHAPPGEALAERIIARAGQHPAPLPPRRPRQWRTWTLPLVAAGSVAAVAATLFGISQVHHTAQPRPPAVSPTSVRITPTPSGTPTVSTVTRHPNGTPSTRPAGPGLAPVPARFTAVDLTFVSSEEGWALGTADCLSRAGTCTAIVHTADGGVSWHGVPTPLALVAGAGGCTADCIGHIRFATSRIGYVFGPRALYLTNDGGDTWARATGGADALETLDGNVIRVAARNACFPPGCTYGVQTAPIGSTAWHDAGLSATTTGTSVSVLLARAGGGSFLEVLGHTSGGAQDARSALFTSANDGATWVPRGEPCAQVSGHEVDSTQLSAAPDGSATVLCAQRVAPGPQFTSTSADGGATFHTGGLDALPSDSGAVLGAASRQVVLVSFSGALYRSSDAGASFTALGGAVPKGATFIGFESQAVGRAIAGAGRTIWTTRDAGVTWSAHTFH